MASFNFFKGYSKLVNPNHPQDQQQTPNPHPRRRLIAISAVLLLTLLIGLMIGALILESNTESLESSSLTSNLAESTVRTFCNVTRYPDSCFSSIITEARNGSPEPDVGSILKTSVKVSEAELSKLAMQLKAMNSDESALGDCREQVDDAVSRLSESLTAMEEVRPGAGERVARMNDIQTWIGAASTDLETCLDGLEEVGSTHLDEVKEKMNNSKEYTSNALAIVANFHVILDKLHLLHH